MVLKTIKTEEAIGQILCHDITKITPGDFKGRLFKKGHIIKHEDIEELLNLGKDYIYVWDEIDGLVHEDEAATFLKDLIMGENIEFTEVKEGKINLVSKVDGLLKIDEEKLFEINMIDEIIVATKPNLSYVKKGDIITSTKVIPLLIDELKLKKAQNVIGKKIIDVKSINKKKVAMVITGNEVYYGRIKDKFADVLLPKLEEFNIDFIGKTIVPDDVNEVTSTINNYLEKGAELIICTGGMSVDPTDITPTAIKNTGSDIISYGMPVLSGSMTLIAYNNDIPIIGLPAGVMFAKKSIADVLLHRLLAGDKISRVDVAKYANGGLL